MIKVLLTGGGSGGHIYPLIALTEELAGMNNLRGEGLAVDYLGMSGDFRVVLENSGITVHLVAGGKFRTYASFLNYFDFLKIVFSFGQAFFKMYFLMPDVLFSKGGPGALPVVLAARFYRVPVIIHDSDSVPGRTNKISAPLASRIAVSFASSVKYFQRSKVALVGNPIRREFFASSEDKRILRAKLGFKEELPLVLVMGSSQGATRINNFIFSAVPTLLKSLQILHQVGIRNYQSAEAERLEILKDLPKNEAERYRVTPFLEDDYVTAIKAADVIVSRASSGSIFEIAAAGIPSILIPLPESAQDHQRENAYEYAVTGAATVIEQENLLPTLFFEQIERILKNPEISKNMSEAAKSFAKPEAAKLIAEEVVRMALRV